MMMILHIACNHGSYWPGRLKTEIHVVGQSIPFLELIWKPVYLGLISPASKYMHVLYSLGFGIDFFYIASWQY